MPRHHLNWLRFALENHDKSRSKQQLLPFYYFFEFRYDDKYTKSSPKRENFLLFGTAFCLSAILSKTCFPADKHILRYVFVVLNRLDGLLVTLLTKKVVAAQPLF